MSKQVITVSDSLGFSRLYRDYIAGEGRARRFFNPTPVESRAAAVASEFASRMPLVDILHRQNRAWRAPQPVFDAISKLADHRAVAVLAGQQACLFGGPYLVLLKALAAVRLAERLERQLSVPVVPIFWIAADDHDIGEVSAVDMFDTAGRLTRLSIDVEREKPSPPVGALKYDDSVRREVERLENILPDNDFKRETVDPIASVYTPGAGIVDSFAAYLHGLTGRFGVVLFNPHDREAKTAAAPVLRRIIERYAPLKAALAETGRALTAAGYHLQVEKAAGAAHLFFHVPERTAIYREGESCIAGETVYTADELIAAASDRPFDFSPDVLTRPIVQSSLFPTVAVIGGPAEVAYFAQMMPLFELFDQTPPEVVPRPSLTIVEARFETLLDRYALSFDDVCGDIDGVITRILMASFPDEISKRLDEFSQAVKSRTAAIRGDLAAYDPDLAPIIDRAGGKIDYLVDEVTKKVVSAHKRKHAVERERLYRLRDHLFPNRGLAERSISPVYFLSRYGQKVIDFIFENLSLEETAHSLLMLSEYDG